LALCKEKARELKLEIKISHVRIDPKDDRAVFQFTSEQRVDFRALVRELSALLKMRIDLWQIGVRDEAKFLDGFGVCGQQTCCSSWMTDFHPISIKMAKQQDINLPPSKLSGQCGRLLCCLSYEVDQYKEMAKDALPKGATITLENGEQGVIFDRNLVARTYTISDRGGTLRTVKADEISGDKVKVPEQMKTTGKTFTGQPREAEEPLAPESWKQHPAPETSTPEPKEKPPEKRQGRPQKKKNKNPEAKTSAPPQDSSTEASPEKQEKKKRGRRGKKKRGKKGPS